MSTRKVELIDHQQTAWQMASIQLCGWTSLPLVATSILILQANSFLGAILTIIVGNAILWFLRLGIISMTFKKRQSTLDLSCDYLGTFGSYFIAIALLVSTLAWFIAQTTTASKSLTDLLSLHENPGIDQFAQISVFLGIISSFLCMEGMPLLRKLSTFAFPVLIALFLIVLFTLPSPTFESSIPLSLSGLTLILSTNLGITSDMPTFFRHSQSWQTSIKALTIIQLLSLGLSLCSLYFSSIITHAFEINDGPVLDSGNTILRMALILFVFVSVICANVANVYSASVGWELLAPKSLVGRKEYLILGLGLTTIFVLISELLPMEILLTVSDNAMINLCIVILLGYFICKFTQTSPSKSDQVIYFLAWILSTTIASLELEHFNSLILSILVILAVMCVGFVGVGMKRRIFRAS